MELRTGSFKNVMGKVSEYIIVLFYILQLKMYEFFIPLNTVENKCTVH